MATGDCCVAVVAQENAIHKPKCKLKMQPPQQIAILGFYVKGQ
jgi:hypothetical protein